jgi:uncharacterized damage-inducible protein DinB
MKITKHLACTPEIVGRLLPLIDTDRWDEAPEPDRFTVRETIAHLADLEEIFLDRIVTAVERPGTEIQPLDTEARAQEKKYGERDPLHEVEVYANRRRETIDYLDGRTSEELDRAYVHPRFGAMSVRDTVHMILKHDLEHTEIVSRYLRYS